MSTPAVPRDLQLPLSQRAQSTFKKQRRQKLQEYLLRRKTLFENEMLSSRGQRAVTSEDQVQERTKVLKLKTEMADKENVKRPWGVNFIPLKPSNELTNSTAVIDTHKPKDSNQTLHQAFHLKNRSKKRQITAEKQKQDANMPKKPVLGSYHDQIVQSKVNSLRKSLQVKDESCAATMKLSSIVPKATKPQPVNTSSVTVKSNRSSSMTATTQSVSTTSQNTLVRPPNRSHHNNTQDTVKQGISRTSAHVTIWKVPCEKELLESKTALSITLSRSTASEVVARPASSSNDKLMEESKPIDQRRHTIRKATVDRSRKARLSEWKAGKGRLESEGQKEKPVGSFWTTMGCPKEDILVTLNDLIKNIPDDKKLAKYWICLARMEPITKNLIWRKYGDTEKMCATKEEVKVVSIEDTDPENLEMESKHHRNVLFQDSEKKQDSNTKEPTHDVKTPNTKTRTSCLIKYNMSTMPYLQRMKRKVQFAETNSAFKELKFLTPVRRSQCLQEKTSKLPDMLKNHCPCVSSLKQQMELGRQTEAFVCHPNAALCWMYSKD
uniref:Cytoskeleton-associated protein 2 C-terminal domain-containing protein n=1 Tax=Saimiri boliviensis boliviensis TaxID=39432 RepID=A0A2K6SU93_SAIBB